MVRSDGTNNASVINPHLITEEDGYIVPSACGPLFEATVLNRAPHEALDGVGTFWELNHSAVSLFTYRFADEAQPTESSGGWPPSSTTAVTIGWSSMHAQRAEACSPAYRYPPTAMRHHRSADVLTTNSGIKLAVHVLAFSNTVSWQFRYEPVPGSYSALTAQQVMDSLTDQMRAVQDLNR